MGIGTYFKKSSKGDKKAEGDAPTQMAEQPPFDEKAPKPFGPYGYGSSRNSLTGSFSTPPSVMEEIKHEVMANYLFQQQCARMWIGDSSGAAEGVLVRKARGAYLAFPPDLIQSQFAVGVLALNLPCAMTVNSRVIKTYLAWTPNATDVPLKGGLRVQILPTMEHLPLARKAQSAAFIASDGLLVVWDDETTNLMPHAQMIENELMDLVSSRHAGSSGESSLTHLHAGLENRRSSR